MLTTFKTPSAITSFMWMPGIPNENGCWIPTDSPYSVTDTSSPSYVYCGPPALPVRIKLTSILCCVCNS